MQKMNDLISRQAAIDALDALCDRECEYSKKQRSVMCGACHLGSAFDVIEQLPSEQPVVRCKDCEWWEKQKDSLQGRCALMQMYPTGQWYCGNAQRKVSSKETELRSKNG